MRDVKNFSAGKWLQFVPLEYAFKQARNDAWLAIYKKIRPKALDSFLVGTERFRNQPVALVIAFEQPWALDWLLRMTKRNLADTAVLVFDNSRRDAARLDIERVCRNRGIPYLALPVNCTRHVDVRDPQTGISQPMEIVDDRWLHIGSIGYNDNFRSKSEFCENLAHAMDEGARWRQLCDDAKAHLLEQQVLEFPQPPHTE